MCGDPAVCMGQGTGHGACYFELFLTWQTGRRAGRKDGMGPVQKAYHFAKILISDRLAGQSGAVVRSACPMRQKGQLQAPVCACLGNRPKCKTKFESELVYLPGRPVASRMCGTGKKWLGTGGCHGDLPDAAGLARRSCFCAVLCSGHRLEHNTRGPCAPGTPHRSLRLFVRGCACTNRQEFAHIGSGRGQPSPVSFSVLKNPSHHN